MYTDKIGYALELAARSHEGQLRKSSDRQIPYIVHPVAVAMMLSAYGYDEETIIAGILHDTVEDTQLSLETIRRTFGKKVSELVQQVTEPSKDHPWEERKEHYRERLKTASLEAQAISCCDKIHNMKSLIAAAATSEEVWKTFKGGKKSQIEKFEKLLLVYEKTLGTEMTNDYRKALLRLSSIDT